MNAADWHTLYKIGLGICIIIFFFGMTMFAWGFSLIGIGSNSIVYLSFASFAVSGVYLLFVIFSYEKFEKAKKHERELDLKHQQEK